MKVLATLLFLLILTAPTRAQIGVGSGTPHPSAALDVQAIDKAFYPPRMTTSQRKALFNPQPGAFVYDLDKGTFYAFDGQNWFPLAFTTDANLAPVERTASDGEVNDGFGSSVAISGDYALVGSPNDDVGANLDQGSVYVFVRSGSTWTQQTKLTIPGGAANDHFGYSVAISGNYALVGVPNADVLGISDVGAAYVFERSGSVWIQRPILFPADGEANDNFGTSVAIAGNFALVGSPLHIIGTKADQGATYVFARPGSSWTQQYKLIATDGAANDQFGSSVAISGNYAVVGSPRSDFGAIVDRGAVYVFESTGNIWQQQAKLVPSLSYQNSWLGASVAISGDYIIAGMPFYPGMTDTPIGKAIVFERSGANWIRQIEITAFDGKQNDQFGASVAVSGDYFLVGAPRSEGGGSGNAIQGAAYLFKIVPRKFNFQRQITSNPPSYYRAGTGVSLSNGKFIIGGPGGIDSKGKVAFGTVDE